MFVTGKVRIIYPAGYRLASKITSYLQLSVTIQQFDAESGKFKSNHIVQCSPGLIIISFAHIALLLFIFWKFCTYLLKLSSMPFASSVLWSRNYLFVAPAPAPAPTLTIISGPATAIYWHFKLF